jgi:integrase
MMWTAGVLGLRWAECAGLRVGHVNVLAGTVTVAEQLGRDGQIGPPKSAAGLRTLSAPVWLLEEIAALLARRNLNGAAGDALLFVSTADAPLHYTNWRRRIWVPACGTAGLAELHFHDLRSLAATVLVVAGVNVKTAQTRLGHSSPQVTLRLYARATSTADREAADKVGQWFRLRDGRATEPEPRPSRRPRKRSSPAVLQWG